VSSSHASSSSPLRRFVLIGFVLLLVLAGVSLLIPKVQTRLAWEWERLTARVKDTVDPHPVTVSTPVNAPQPTAAAIAVLLMTPSPVPQTTAVPTATPYVLPPAFEITGIKQTYQHPNNCGPATLATDLNFWGWKGTQANTAAVLKPDPRDYNVSPDEMAAFAKSVGLNTLIRVAGTAEQIKYFISIGIPVIVEKSTFLADDDPTGGGWAGHYTVVTGYSDLKSVFTTQDSLEGPNLLVSYKGFFTQWRSFNYLYLLIYPPAREAEVQRALGDDANAQTNFKRAALQAQQEINTETGQNQAFAWFDLGTNLNALGDYANAATAFDQARRGGLPWRMLWYQFGPYEAYYHTGRYQDVIDLAKETLAARDNLEESYYWRGMARLALGDKAGAIEDWQTAVKLNHNYAAAAKQLETAGK
jgi:hypothetical protein